MKLFKALLCLSVLSLTVSAAPQNILAGRVLSPHVGHLAQNIGLIPNIQSLRPFLRSGGFPAFSLLRSVPAVSAISAVRAVPSVQAVPALSAIPQVQAVP